MSEPKILRIGFDWGTKTLNAAFHIASVGEPAKMSTIHPVQFEHMQYQAPMIGGWLDNGDFSCGFELDGALTTEHASYENVIRLVKLALYDSHKTSKLVEKINRQLREHAMDLTTFVSKHLQRCHLEVIDYMKRTWINDTFIIDELEQEIYISVPQMWNPSSCKIMMDAAKQAGFPKTELVPEPLCAAAHTNEGMRTYGRYYADAMRYAELEHGDVVQVADLGGGTGDFTSYELLNADLEGSNVVLRAVGTPQGALCGSEFINLAFLKWLAEECREILEQGGIADVCSRMNLTREAFDAKASAAFETIKTRYPWAPQEVLTFGGGKNTVSAFITIPIKGETIVRLFDDLIDTEIIPMMDKQIESVNGETKMIIVPGGFAHSKHLMRRLRAKYDPLDAEIPNRIKIYDNLRIHEQPYNPVPTGLLLYYKQIIQRGIPAPFTFGITQVEVFDPELHPDAVLHYGQRHRDGRFVYDNNVVNTDIVKRDPIDSDLEVVLDRFVTLVAKGLLTVPGRNAADVSKWQMQYIELGEEGEFTTTIYWTESEIEDHDPIHDKRGNMRPDVHVWTTSTITIDPKECGFKLLPRKDGKAVYQIWWNLSLVFDGANASIEWKIMKPGRSPFDRYGVLKRGLRDAEFFEAEVLTIMEGEHNPFVRE